MCIYKIEKICELRTGETLAKQGLHYLFEILLSCCVAPYELSRNSTPFTGLTVTFSSDLGYSFTMAIFYNLPQFLLRGLFSIFIYSMNIDLLIYLFFILFKRFLSDLLFMSLSIPILLESRNA